RQRVWSAARRIERARAGEPRHSDLPLDPTVIRLEVGVTDRPIGEPGSLDWSLPASLDEIDFVEAPVIRGEVHRAAADQTTILDHGSRHGCLRLRGAEGVGL